MEKNERKWEHFPVIVYVGEELVQDIYAIDELTRAIDFWNTKANKEVLRYGGTAKHGIPQIPQTGEDRLAENGVFLLSPWNFESNHAGRTIVLSEGQTIKNAVIYLNPSNASCTQNCADTSQTPFQLIIAHELGHFIGLNHSQSLQNIMYPQIRRSMSLNSATVDKAVLSRLTH